MKKNNDVGIFLVMDKQGDKIYRNLREESDGYTQEKYFSGEFDALNYVWHENFDFNDVFESIGCDYERMGCFIKEGDVVLDPFMGTGTTGVVCKKLGRNYIGFDLQQDYIDVANKRIEEC